jgi:hypothetical protein
MGTLSGRGTCWFKNYGPQRERWAYPGKSYFDYGVVAEPPTACWAVNGRRIIAWLIVGRHGLTQGLHVFVLVFHFSHHWRGYLLQIRKAMVPCPKKTILRKAMESVSPTR